LKALLVCMPFAEPSRPALALSLLKACLAERAIECDVAYFNLLFARLLGVEDYQVVAARIPPAALSGEWVFAGDFDGAGAGDGSYVTEVLQDIWFVDGERAAAVRRARSLSGPFLDLAFASVDWEGYEVVGFTSSVAQNLAALSLALRVKESFPQTCVMFGGHNWDGSMGSALHERLPFVDHSFSGCSERSFLQVMEALARGDKQATPTVRGPAPRRAGRHVSEADECAASLDALPVPDHSDYFGALREHGLEDDIRPVIPMETSRGCWWASTGPCLFCGVNGGRRDYVSKSTARIVQEAEELTVRWPGLRLDVVDNIVSRRFLAEVLPQVKGGAGISLRVRPDVTPRELEAIAAAGGSITCGIESFSQHLLDLMGKGVDGRTNIRLLEHCGDLGIQIDWNLLYGIPGETVQDYAEQVDIVERLMELEPPVAVLPVQLERSSPFWHRPASYGFGRPAPAAAYGHVYPFAQDELGHIAYFFDHDYRPGLRVTLHVARLRRVVSEWRDRRKHQTPAGLRAGRGPEAG
jgi:ribosomal peptide maturation radical SAM protein 1